MREPYETLLGAYRDHWLLGRYLEGDVPNWAGMIDDPQMASLSDGEQLMARIAWCFWNGSGDVLLADLARLDRDNRLNVAQALLYTCEV